jgi:hypothetical protein
MLTCFIIIDLIRIKSKLGCLFDIEYVKIDD